MNKEEAFEEARKMALEYGKAYMAVNTGPDWVVKLAKFGDSLLNYLEGYRFDGDGTCTQSWIDENLQRRITQW